MVQGGVVSLIFFGVAMLVLFEHLVPFLGGFTMSNKSRTFIQMAVNSSKMCHQNLQKRGTPRSLVTHAHLKLGRLFT